MVGSKMSYKNSLERFLKIHFPSEEVEVTALELISELLNEINSLLISHIKAEYNSSGSSRQILEQYAANAINENFPEELRTFALSEANRQLTLLNNGFIVYREGGTEAVGQKQTGSPQTEDRDSQKQMKRRKRQEKTKSEKTEFPTKPFIDGVGKLSSAFIPNLKVDAEALKYLALRIQAFSKMIAERASEKFRQEELQPVNLKNIFSEYLGKNALKNAISEGNKCLTLYENDLLAFKPRKTTISDVAVKVKKPRIKKHSEKIDAKKSLYTVKQKKKAKIGKPSIEPSRKRAKRSSVTHKRKSSKSAKRPSSPKRRRIKSALKSKGIRKPSKKTDASKKLSSVKRKKIAKAGKPSTKPSRKSPRRSSVPRKRKSSKSPKRPPSSKRKRSRTPYKGTRIRKHSKKIASPKKLSPVKRKKITKFRKSRTKPSRRTPRRSSTPKKRKASKSPKRLPSSKKKRSQSSPKGTKIRRPSTKTGAPKVSSPVKRKKIAKVEKPSAKIRRKSSERLTVSKKSKSSRSQKRPSSTKKKISKSPSTGKGTKKRTKETIAPKRREKTVEVEKPSTKSSKKKPQRLPASKKKGTPKRPPAATKIKSSKSSSTGTRRTKKPSKITAEFQKCATDIISIALAAFSDIDVSLANEATIHVKGILEEICQALIDVTVSNVSNDKEVKIEYIKAALLKLFPRELANHGLSVALEVSVSVS